MNVVALCHMTLRYNDIVNFEHKSHFKPPLNICVVIVGKIPGKHLPGIFFKEKSMAAKYEQWITPEGLLKIEGWARDGLTMQQIADNMGVGRKTLNNWMNRFPVLASCIRRGKDVPDRHVENALYKRAVGYEYEEITYNGEDEVVKRVVKAVLPDTTAQIFWLKNRKPDVWRDRHEIVKDNDNDQVMAFIEAMKAHDSAKC